MIESFVMSYTIILITRKNKIGFSGMLPRNYLSRSLRRNYRSAFFKLLSLNTVARLSLNLQSIHPYLSIYTLIKGLKVFEQTETNRIF